ncbi:MAG: hypothetical protein ACTTJH_07240 [Bacteroidales bacterium]
MKKICILVISLSFSCILFSQEENLLNYDECKEEVSKNLIKKYIKAVNYFKEKKYRQTSLLLQEIIKEDEDFASPYFLMGMIGVVKDNTAMIMKYFPLTKDKCPNFSHPYLHYYLGIIDYTKEHYTEASQNFETFMSLTSQNNNYDSLQKIAINYINWSDFLSTTMNNKVPFNPQKINFLAKNKNYYEPFITWDKQEIYFIREEIRKDTSYDSFSAEVSTFTNRYLQRSLLDSTGFYDKGFILEDPFNNTFPLSGVSITADNNYIFYSVKSNIKDNESWDIYYCERLKDYFSNAKPININTNTYDEFSPCISADGNTLYFVSNRSGGKGGYDIWLCKRTGKDTWSEPTNMGRNVNTFGDETYPFIAADNSHLYFLSNGRQTLGGSDIFVYDIQKDSSAQNIGYPINTEANERAMGISLDGKTAYSTFKNINNKFYELNLFTLDKKFQAEERVLVDADIQKTLHGDISLSLLTTDNSENISYYVADNHPNIKFVIRKDKDYICLLDQKGYMFYVTKLNAASKNITIKQKALETGSSIELNCINFDTNGVHFDDISQIILDSFIIFLKSSTRLRINITSNEKMAIALKDYLIKSGIRQDRLSFTISKDTKIIYTIQ